MRARRCLHFANATLLPRDVYVHVYTSGLGEFYVGTSQY